MKRILVPTDFSEYSDCAAKIAAALAGKTGAEVHLIHVLYTSVVDWAEVQSGADQYPETRERTNEAKHKLEEYQEWEAFKDIKLESHLYFNENTREILKHAKDLNVDLIVMGSHGANKMSEVLLGSTSRKIVRLSPCPVICASDFKGSFNPKKVLLTSDFSEKSIASYQPVLDLAALFNCQVFLVWVDISLEQTEEEFPLDELKDALHDRFGGIQQLQVIYDSNIRQGLMEYAEDIEADLIATATHGRTGLSRLIMGSVSEDLINHSEIPVMTVHIK